MQSAPLGSQARERPVEAAVRRVVGRLGGDHGADVAERGGLVGGDPRAQEAGIAIAAMMPMIATTISSSMSVKPAPLRFTTASLRAKKGGRRVAPPNSNRTAC